MFSVLSWQYLVHNFFLSCEVETLPGLVSVLGSHLAVGVIAE